MKTNRLPLIDSPDEIRRRILEKSARHLTRWGSEWLDHKLIDVANLTFDGRRVRRNWDLVEALKADPRFAVRYDQYTPFFEVRVSVVA